MQMQSLQVNLMFLFQVEKKMEKFCLADVESSRRKERNQRIQRSSHILKSPFEDFMQNYLDYERGTAYYLQQFYYSHKEHIDWCQNIAMLCKKKHTKKVQNTCK